MNINEWNFNNTCRGYVVRALNNQGATKEQIEQILIELRWAFEQMDFEEARRTYDKYCKGEITFK